MNHAKLETYYRIFDASIVPVCAGGCARLTEALAARLGRKVTDTASRSWGAPQRQGASDGKHQLADVEEKPAAGRDVEGAVSR